MDSSKLWGHLFPIQCYRIFKEMFQPMIAVKEGKMFYPRRIEVGLCFVRSLQNWWLVQKLSIFRGYFFKKMRKFNLVIEHFSTINVPTIAEASSEIPGGFNITISVDNIPINTWRHNWTHFKYWIVFVPQLSQNNSQRLRT